MLRGRPGYSILFLTLFLLAIPVTAQTPIVSTWKFRKGFFVLGDTTHSGNLGGLVGANAICLAELTSTDWMGKQQANLTPGKVRAFLCNGATCQNPLPNQYYYFASTSFPLVGGAYFKANASGQGPGNANDWSAADHFNEPAAYTWTGRGIGTSTLWSAASAPLHCLGWTSGAVAQNGYGGDPSFTNASRWNDNIATACNTSLYLICMVDP